MVTSQNILSPLMIKIDNRGSKLEFYNFIFNSFKNKFIADKEQRVYESKYINTLYLRSTLMNFERNYQF
jgi:hypothetical protein